MGARAFLLVSALTVLASPVHADGVDTRAVEVRDSVRKVIGHCTYTAEVAGWYQRGAVAGSVREALVNVSSRLQCRHQAPVWSRRQLAFAATSATELGLLLSDAASLEYEPQPGRLCRVATTLRAEPAGPVFSDLAMTCFADQPTAPH